MPDPPDPSVKPPIFNAVLAYMKFLMLSRDRAYLQEAIIARFSLDDLINAHKVISSHCEPDSVHSKRGPNKAGRREKMISFFDDTYRIMCNLDKEGLSPVIACPAENLGVILNLNGHCDQKLNEARFQQLEEKVSKFGILESTVTELRNTVSTLLSGKSHPSLPASTVLSSERLLKENTARGSSPDVVFTPQKVRSDSVVSNKRGRVEDDELLDSDMEFIEPRYNSRKADKRLKRLSDNKLPFNKGTSSSVNPSMKSAVYRRKANWGKTRNTSSSGLTDAIQDLFVFHCAGNPDEKVVKSYLESHSINVTSVEMKSHKDAFRKSFRVSVASHGDYDKLLAGEILPVGTGVKPFIPSRSVHASHTWKTTSSTVSPSVSSNALNEFIKEGELLKSTVSEAAKPSGLVVSKNTPTNSDINTAVCHNG